METMNYFIHNGIKYYQGTIVRILVNSNNKNEPKEVDAVFVRYQDNQYYIFKPLRNTFDIFDKIGYWILKEQIDSSIINIINGNINAPENKQVRIKEEYIPDIANAWIWYIIVMITGALFYSRLVIWAITSIAFFTWRENKIKGG